MKNSKVIFRLLAVIAVLLIANYYVFFCNDTGKSLVKRATLIASSEKVNSFVLISTNGVSLSFRKTDARGWAVVSPLKCAADERVVMKILDSLAFTEITDTVGEGDLLRHGMSRVDYGLDPARLSVEVPNGSDVIRVIFGSATPTGSGVFAAVDESNEVYVLPMDVFTTVNVLLDDVRRRNLFDVLAEKVVSLEVQQALMKPVSFSLEDAGQRLSPFIAEVVGSSAIDFIWPHPGDDVSEGTLKSLASAYGLDRDSAVVLRLKCIDGKDRQIMFGKGAGDGKVYAKTDSGTMVTVASSLAERLLKVADEFGDARIFRLDAGEVQSITVVSGLVTYVLAREDAISWRLDSPVSAPADTDSANALLSRILAFSASDVSTNENDLVVSVSSNLPPARVSESALLGDLRLEDLRSREIVKLDRELVKRIVSTDADGNSTAVVFNRELKAWNVEGGDGTLRVDVDSVSDILSAVSPLAATRVERLKTSPEDLVKYGLEKPVLSIALDSEGEGVSRKNILVGSKAKGGRYLTVGSSDAIFVIPGSVFKKLSGKIVE